MRFELARRPALIFDRHQCLAKLGRGGQASIGPATRLQQLTDASKVLPEATTVLL